MSTNSTREMKDRTLFVAIVKAHKCNVAVVSVNAARLNHPGSPVWDSGENVAPILVMLMVSVLFMFLINLIVGIATMTLSALMYPIFIRSWILQRVHRRALDAAMQNLHNWDLLWKKGGLAVTLYNANSSRCVSPAGDWRAFASRYFHNVNLDGTEIYDAFTQAEKNDADLKAKSDLQI